jgi:hypothetical protein
VTLLSARVRLFGMTYSAPKIIKSLVNEYGWDAIVDALIEEVKWAPGGELGAIEELLDVVMADLVAGEAMGRQTLQ